MLKKSLIVILAALLSVVAFGKETDANALLRDGFALSGVDGKLIVLDKNSTYYFKLDAALKDDKAVIEARTTVELLPSAGLEKMTASAKQEPGIDFCVWGKVTGYKGKNYFFIDNFLPVSQIKKTEKISTAQQNKTDSNEPNDELTLPAHILEKLTAKKIIHPVKLRKGLSFEQDHIMADRTGFIVKQPDDGFVFVFDALGRKLENISITLLPCQVLERTWQKQLVEPERIRFKAAGIVTKYKGRYYLLLQRARRVYSYGNFGK